MRKLLIPLLLASAIASPALADPNMYSGRQHASSDREQSGDDARAEHRQAREERSSDADRAQSSRMARSDRQMEVRQQAVDQGASAGFAARADRRDTFRAARQAQRADQFGASQPERIEQTQERFQNRHNRDQIRDAGDLRQSDRPVPRVMRNPVRVVSDTPREGTQPPLRNLTRSTRAVEWNTNWRHNGRYDWQDYRRHHRSSFHLGFYYDPYGWGYQPYSIGSRLWPSYYGSRYQINDPWQYRLPYAPPGYVWVRYWNDALLIDTWTGQVVDEIPNFFW